MAWMESVFPGEPVKEESARKTDRRKRKWQSIIKPCTNFVGMVVKKRRK
jgi:hypothetical protein